MLSPAGPNCERYKVLRGRLRYFVTMAGWGRTVEQAMLQCRIPQEAAETGDGGSLVATSRQAMDFERGPSR
jgi:hypothetical protein